MRPYGRSFAIGLACLFLCLIAERPRADPCPTFSIRPDVSNFGSDRGELVFENWGTVTIECRSKGCQERLARLKEPAGEDQLVYMSPSLDSCPRPYPDDKVNHEDVQKILQSWEIENSKSLKALQELMDGKGIGPCCPTCMCASPSK
jgi:hypothetical protein